MATRFIDKAFGANSSTAIANDSTGTGKLPNYPDAAGIAIDSVDGFLKYNDGGAIRVAVNTDEAQTLSNKNVLGSAPVAYTSGTSLTLTQAAHQDRVVYVTDVASNYVLPAATGTGDRYTIVLGATQTGAGTIKTGAGDSFIGNAVLFADGGATVVGFSAVAGDNTIDLLGTANSTGGMLGAIYEFIDVAANKYEVNIISDAGGTEATPFSTV